MKFKYLKQFYKEKNIYKFNMFKMNVTIDDYRVAAPSELYLTITS